MSNLLGRFFGSRDDVPEWARFFEPADFQAFLGAVETEMKRRGYDYEIGDGTLRIQPPGEEASDAFTTLASRLGVDPLTAVLEGGEDYELLFTASPRERAPPEEELPVTRIGEIIAGDGELLISGDGTTTRWEVSGFDHYRA